MNYPEYNFCRVYELPETYPSGYLFHGGKYVSMLMVDWFTPVPDPTYQKHNGLNTWEDIENILKKFLSQKNYCKPDKTYLVVTEFGKAFTFTKETPQNG